MKRKTKTKKKKKKKMMRMMIVIVMMKWQPVYPQLLNRPKNYIAGEQRKIVNKMMEGDRPNPEDSEKKKILLEKRYFKRC